jgi:RecA-family ATPase
LVQLRSFKKLAVCKIRFDRRVIDMSTKTFLNFPDELAELRPLKQWIVWRYENTGGSKPTKVPYDPRTGRHANVTIATTWTDFDEALAALVGNGSLFDGIGFVLIENSQFTIIDLDDTEGNAALLEKHHEIVRAFGSYTEISPSGNGVHIWVRGTTKDNMNNRKRKIEIYSSKRYMTFTGNVYYKAPIEARQSLLDTLCFEVRPHKVSIEQSTVAESPAPEVSDEAVCEFICASEANRLNYEGEASDWSSAYFALICATCLVSSNEAQVRRVVLASPLVLNTPPKGKETRLHKAERLWATEYARASAKGAQERQDSDQIRRSVIIDTTLPPGFNLRRSAKTSNNTDWFSASDFAGKFVPPRKWHVCDLIPVDVTLFSGDGGTGKSLIGKQLAASTATGTQWLGLDVREGKALYLSAEDDIDEMHRRLAAFGRVAEMHRLKLRSLAGQDALLAVPRDRTGILTPKTLFEALDARMAQESPVLLVLDTLADFFGGNENDRAQVRQFIGMLRGLAIRHSCAVLLLSHPSVAGMASGVGSSGSTAWNNSVRSRLYLSRIIGNDGFEPNPDARRLTVKKSNYGRIGKEIIVHWHNGAFIAEDRPALMESMAKAEVVFLKILSEFMSQGRRVNASGGQGYAPNIFAAHPESAGITKRAFKDAMEKLLAKGRIQLVETGPASKRRSHLEIKSDTATLFHPPSVPQNSHFQPNSDTFPASTHPPSNSGGSNPL